MTQLLGMLGTIFDLALVIVGFGLIVFFHELGHYLAARWAGIRVLAFAMGIGPPLVSYRPGLGWRRGSSEGEYQKLIEDARGEAGDRRERARSLLAGTVSPTEYRLCWLPFGGYVKMLGQEDLHPERTSAEPDSYQNAPVWKRMVVISAGVTMNVALAAVLFVAVFLVGLRTEPPEIGAVVPGSPASKAAPRAAAVEPGLRAGDRIESINGREPNSFNDLILAAAMSSRGGSLDMRVRRPGAAAPLEFSVKPEQDPLTGLMMMGVEPARSATIFEASNAAEAEAIRRTLAAAGLAGVEPGMTLVRVDDNRTVRGGQDLVDAVRTSGGRPVEAEFGGPDSKSVTVTIQPRPALSVDRVPMGPGEFTPIEHVLGLAPVLQVRLIADQANDRGREQGLRDGDIFARLGSVEFPSVPAGIAEVRRHRGKSLPVVLLRAGADEALAPVSLTVSVSREGLIGFSVDDTADESALLAAPLGEVFDSRGQARGTPAAALSVRPGSRVLRVGQTEVTTLREMHAAVREATRPHAGSPSVAAVIPLTIELPLPPQPGEDAPPTTVVDWSLTAEDVARLHEAGWTSQVSLGLFKPAEFLLRANGPVGALTMGLEETRRVILMTYVTFARLFEQTVKVEHLKGPIGIAHLGTRIADRGLIWLLFFMGLISINLAVVNFLPLPIVDGGQFVFLVYEGIRGRPVSPGIQNAATAAGLLLIGAVFLIVTFNDIAALFG